MKVLTRQTRILAFLIIAISLPVLFQNCAGKLRGPASASASLFADNKMQIPLAKIKSAGQIQLSVLVNEAARKQGRCQNPQSFVQQYIATPQTSRTTAMHAYSVQVPVSVLSSIASDPCVVGATVQRAMSVKTADVEATPATASVMNVANVGATYLPSAAQAETQLKTAINYSSLQARLTTELNLMTATKAQPVRIAILSTGIALGSPEFTNVVADVSGFNLVAGESASIPTDDHFVGSGSASLLSATGATQTSVKGLFNGLFQILPFRVAPGGAWNAPDALLEIPYLVQLIRNGSTQSEVLGLTGSSPAQQAISKTLNDADILLQNVQGDWTAKQVTAVISGIGSVVTQLKSLQQFAQQASVSASSPFAQTLSTLIASVPVTTYDFYTVQGILDGFTTSIPQLPDLASAAGADPSVVAHAQTFSASLTSQLATLRAAAVATPPSEAQRLFIVNQLQVLQQDFASVQANLATLPDPTGLIAQFLNGQMVTTMQLAQQALVDTVVVKPLAIDNTTVANAILEAVNMGADVIQIPFSSNSDQCDPIIGEAINLAIQAGSFVVLAGGDEAQNVNVPSSDQLTPLATSSPACWGGYFKGAVSVAGIKTAPGQPNMSQFSNFGAAMKIAAPDTAIPLLDSTLQPRVYSGSAFSSTLVTGAAALLVAYHKNRQITTYEPWMIENLLLNSSALNAGLVNQVPTQKYLDFGTLAQSLSQYDDLTPAQRFQVLVSGDSTPSNQLDGVATSAGLIIEGANNVLHLNDRLQLTAKFVDAKGAAQGPAIVTWSVSDTSALSISNAGILTSASSALGRFTVTAVSTRPQYTATFDVIKVPVLPAISGLSFLWKTAQTIMVQDPKTGNDSQLCSTNRQVTGNIQLQIGTQVTFTLVAFYADGTMRDVTSAATILQGAPGKPSTRKPGPTSFELTSNQTGGIEIVGYFQGFSTLVDLYATNGIPTYATSADSAALVVQAAAAVKTLTASGPVGLSTAFQVKNTSTNAALTIGAEANRYMMELFGTAIFQFTDATGSSKTLLPSVQMVQYRLRDANYTTYPVQYLAANGEEYVNLYALSLKAGTYYLQVYDPVDDVWGEFQFTYYPSTHLHSATGSNPVNVTAANATTLKATSAICKDASKLAATPFASGTGVPGDPYIICTPTQLNQTNKYLYDSRRLVSLSDGALYFQLGDNLDMTGITNMMLGSYSSFSSQKCLLGSFDGAGYAIQNYTYADSQQDYVGLFACMNNYSTLQNLILINPVILGHDYVGGLVGYDLQGTIENVQVIGSTANHLATISGHSNVGGIAGSLPTSAVQYSAVSGVRILASGDSVGGVAGFSSCVANFLQLLLSDVAVSYSGAPSVAGNSYGGVTGGAGSIQSALFQGTVNGSSNVAGIGGHRLASVTFSGTVSGTGDNVAGLVAGTPAVNGGAIEFSTFSGTVSGRYNVAGITAAAELWTAQTNINNTKFDGSVSSAAPDGNQHLSGAFIAQLSNIFRAPALAFKIPLADFETYRIWNNTYNQTKTPLAPVAIYVGASPAASATTILNYAHPGITPFSGNAAGVLTPVLVGLPKDPSNQTMLQIFVSGSGIAYYKYKIGAAGTIDCTGASGYGIPRATNLAIFSDMASLPDGRYTLCVLSADSTETFTPWSSAFSYSWTKAAGSVAGQLN